MKFAQVYIMIAFILFGRLAQAAPETTIHKIEELKQSAAKQIAVKDCWIRLMPENLPSAGYFSLQNLGNTPVVLNKIISPDFDMTMMHETLWKGAASSMVMLKNLGIAAKETVLFTPGGRHFMLEKPNKILKVGQEALVKLVVADKSEYEAKCLIKAASAK